jgi:hypothetical protein
MELNVSFVVTIWAGFNYYSTGSFINIRIVGWYVFYKINL